MNDVPGRSLPRREVNALLAMSCLAGAFLAVLVWFLMPQLFAPLFHLPQAVSAGLGTLVLGLSLYPALRAHGRLEQPPRVFSGKRYFSGWLIGSLVAALLFAVLEAVFGV